MSNKQRLDVLMVEKGLAPSRERAKAWIMAGVVIVNGQKIDKAGTLIIDTANISVINDSIGFVSRGGLKLAKAIKCFGIDLHHKVMADIGASTGGFTDCALQNGVARVYAIDVGYGQLAWSLRTDDRVKNMERTNVRNVKPEDIGEEIDFASIDVAFISLSKVLPAVKALLSEAGSIVALIKPQFEAGREKVGKKGVVRDPLVHRQVINDVIHAARALGLTPIGLAFSPIKGPEGNIEYLLYLANYKCLEIVSSDTVDEIVSQAHLYLTKED
ncbi:16S/23S rRNA (cytidine-2'-O)-methyltransferase TlyA [bioreactor metagenome]|uniref:16S/23S rRNA (Cytidine-2'-O)-methyltransferase TlyA n=1 Tax=bioreactor metagenome TaxID=1076179 RepID=A0A644UZF2_9ZZZZ|nr:TlyA family RNA methyltransferase [Negativicutes bacterium]